MNINYPPENLDGGRMKLSGNALLGERGKFNIRKIEININNQGFVTPTYLTSRDNSDSQTIYEFHHEFEPWSGVTPKDQWSESYGFSAHIRATSYQSAVEEEQAFIFWPFTLFSVETTGERPIISFKIPSKNLDYIKDNISHFEIYLGKDGNWNKYISKVSKDLIGTDGNVIISETTNTVESEPINLSPGTYQAKVKVFDKWGYSFESNTIDFQTKEGIYSAGNRGLSASTWFPLQINKITGSNTGIISSFNPLFIKPLYQLTTLKPTITGIAFSGAEVNLKVVNNSDPSQTKTFTTTVNSDSTWIMVPHLFPDSMISISVSKDEFFNSLPSFNLKLSQPVSEEIQGVSITKQEERSPFPTFTPSPTAKLSPKSTPEPQEENKRCLWFICW